MVFGEYSEESDLDSSLEVALEAFEENRKVFWREEDDSEDTSAFLEVVNSIGDMLLKASETLLQPIPQGDLRLAWANVRTLTGSQLWPMLERETLTRIQLKIAERSSIHTRWKAKRCLELSELILDARPNERVLRYLSRLGRCYIEGFDAECVVLCRAVFENALREKFGEEDIPFPAGENGKSQVGSAIKMATRSKWFSRIAIQNDWPWMIWELGSKAVHYDPTAYRDPFGMIKMTLHVLGDLYGRADQTSS